jgi:hypothetical protein
MLDLLEGLKAWPLLLLALAVFGFLPGVVLRVIVLAFRRDDPRRAEILAERYAVPRWEQPFWVADQAQRALFEGLLERIRSRLRTSRRREVWVLKESGNIVFTKPHIRHDLLSTKKYPQGTSGIVTKFHTGLLGDITGVDVRLADGTFVRDVPVDYFSA